MSFNRVFTQAGCGTPNLMIIWHPHFFQLLPATHQNQCRPSPRRVLSCRIPIRRSSDWSPKIWRGSLTSSSCTSASSWIWTTLNSKNSWKWLHRRSRSCCPSSGRDPAKVGLLSLHSYNDLLTYDPSEKITDRVFVATREDTMKGGMSFLTGDNLSRNVGNRCSSDN